MTPKSGNRFSTCSEWADRKIAKPQVGEAALLPDPEQRPVEAEPHDVIAFLDRDPDALSEVAAVEIGPATEGATVLRIGAVEPESERYSIPEQQVDVAAPEREPGHLVVRIGKHLGLREQGLQV